MPTDSMGKLQIRRGNLANLPTGLDGEPLFAHDVGELFIGDGTGEFLAGSGGSYKPACRVATTANITLSGTQTIDGVPVVAGDRVLVKNQTTGSQNGIYLCAAGAWTRAADFNYSPGVTAGLLVVIGPEGSANKNTIWQLQTAAPITIATTALTFGNVTGSGSIPLTTKGDLLTYGTGLQRHAVGSDNQVLTADSTQPDGVAWKAAASSSGTPTGYIDITPGNDFIHRWLTTTTFSVGKGKARDGQDAADVTLSSLVSMDITTNGVAGGDDSKAIAGTVTVPGAGNVITGSSTAFLTEFGTRAGTGKITTSGTAVTGSNGSKFTQDLGVGDLIGTATNGYSQVTAIASDTGATITAALPGGDIAVAAAFNVIESPTLDVPTTGCTRRHVTIITDGTHLTVDGATLNDNVSGKTAYKGRRGNGMFLYTWLASGGSGTTVYVSTQRTTPYGVTGYTTSTRLLTALPLDASANLIPFTHVPQERRMCIGGANNVSSNTQVFTNHAGTNNVWTQQNISSTSTTNTALVPPIARTVGGVGGTSNSASFAAFVEVAGSPDGGTNFTGRKYPCWINSAATGLSSGDGYQYACSFANVPIYGQSIWWRSGYNGQGGQSLDITEWTY